MASGCILGVCFVCNDHVYEDQLGWSGDRMKHTTCKTISDVRLENRMLHEELKEYRQWISGKGNGDA
ncbi:hypothetical protein [Paenibacillus daejeonensis]|uniref:hypothetical protein n=1 Tax=Paenibacillus daejeonensis TaxID=135193 RepID=UPI00036BCF43|nr:hypothetical protein [Paenibacillus daejeonensis]